MYAYGGMLKKLCERKEYMHVTPNMVHHAYETIHWKSNVAAIHYTRARLGNDDNSIVLNMYGHLSKRSAQMNNKKINDYTER